MTAVFEPLGYEPLVCAECGWTVITHNEELGVHQMAALREHMQACAKVAKDRYWRIRRHQEPGWWAGSYSSISNYDECPRLYKFEIDAKSRNQGIEALLGNAVHADAQRQGEGQPTDNGDVPLDKYAEFRQLQRAVREHHVPGGATYEQVWFIEWGMADGRRAQIRCKVDAVWVVDGVAYLIDWKSGKYNNEGIRKKWAMQRQIYALAAVRNLPDVYKVVAFTVHLPSGYIYPSTDGDRLGLGEIEQFAVYLEQKVDTIGADTEFKANTGLNCKLCRWVTKCDAAQEALSEYELEVKVVNGKQTITIPKSLADDPQFIENLQVANYQLSKLLGDVKKVLNAAKQEPEEDDEEEAA